MIFVSAAALAALTQTALAPPDPDWNCADAIRQQEMNWCAAQDFNAAERALKAQWQATAAKMKERDADFATYQPEGDGRPGWFHRLIKAQRAWLAYREAHCQLDGYTARGGTLEPLLVSTCMTALTEDRTGELRALAESPD
ncbi:MAG: lysozyme inhibitor LprI family protein [Pseudomonadota bacterium]